MAYRQVIRACVAAVPDARHLAEGGVLRTTRSLATRHAGGRSVPRDRWRHGPPARGRLSGSENRNVLPVPTSLSAQMFPPWASTINQLL